MNNHFSCTYYSIIDRKDVIFQLMWWCYFYTIPQTKTKPKIRKNNHMTVSSSITLQLIHQHYPPSVIKKLRSMSALVAEETRYTIKFQEIVS